MLLATLAVLASTLVDTAKEYRLGVDFAPQINVGTAFYETEREGELADGCAEVSASRQRCGLILFPRKLSSWGVFLQKPYKRTGNFFFDYGASFALRQYESEMIGTTANPDEPQTALVEKPKPPIQRMSTNLYGVSSRGFLKGGFTPDHAPEVYLTYGLGLAVMAGTIRIDDEIDRHVFATPVLFQELEVLWLRMLKDGSFSSYLALETPYKKTVVVAEDRDDVDSLAMSLMSITVGLAKVVIPFN